MCFCCCAVVRSSALNPLYEALPVLIVDDWSHVTPSLLRAFYANYTIMRPLYQYERLFADYWIGRFAVSRERCLASTTLVCEQVSRGPRPRSRSPSLAARTARQCMRRRIFVRTLPSRG